MESTESSPKFQQYWMMLKRRWLPAFAVFVSVSTLITWVSSLKKPVYLAEGTLLFRRLNTSSSLTEVGKQIGKLEPLAEKSNPLATEAEVMRSVPIIEKTIAKLNLTNKKGVLLKRKEFLTSLTVIDLKGTDILKVSYKDTKPKKAAEIVNTVMALYLENNILFHRTEAVAARKFIEKQLPEAEATVRQAEENMRQFKEKNKVVALEQEASSAVAIIADLQKQISDTQAKLANTTPQVEVLRSRLGLNSQQAVTASILSETPGIKDVLSKLQTVQSQLAVKLNRYTEADPKIINLRDEEAALKATLQERIAQIVGTGQQVPDKSLQVGELQQNLTKELVNLEATKLGLANQVAALSNIQTTYRERVNILPKLEQEQLELKRKLEVSQASYSLLLNKLKEIQVAENQNVGNARIISLAQVPEEPTSSKKTAYLSAGLLGLIASAAIIYILEATDKSIKTIQQARDIFKYTLLGVIPSLEKLKKATRRDQDLDRFTPEVIVRDTPRSPISESYRMLQANLKFLSSDKELKAVAITSSVPREGKSTVSANLAAAIAQRDRKVLLVDADLYNPIQHRIWDLRNDVGLSNVLVGQAELENSIQEVMKNLDILTSGVVPPNPAILLDSQRMASLIEDFVTHYDFVIVDTPSLNVAADAPILGKMIDGVLLVVRPVTIDSASAAFAKDILAHSGQNVLGLVVNGVIPNHEPHSYYYFSQEYTGKEFQNDKAQTRTKS
jgi:succinoglycan biosynthesis transport protein ExoP